MFVTVAMRHFKILKTTFKWSGCAWCHTKVHPRFIKASYQKVPQFLPLRHSWEWWTGYREALWPHCASIGRKTAANHFECRHGTKEIVSYMDVLILPIVSTLTDLSNKNATLGRLLLKLFQFVAPHWLSRFCAACVHISHSLSPPICAQWVNSQIHLTQL